MRRKTKLCVILLAVMMLCSGCAEEKIPPEEIQIESEKIDATIDGQTVTFETDGFSIYAFAYAVVTYYKSASGETYELCCNIGTPKDAGKAMEKDGEEK